MAASWKRASRTSWRPSSSWTSRLNVDPQEETPSISFPQFDTLMAIPSASLVFSRSQHLPDRDWLLRRPGYMSLYCSTLDNMSSFFFFVANFHVMRGPESLRPYFGSIMSLEIEFPFHVMRGLKCLSRVLTSIPSAISTGSP
ncbi:hypothetical protein Taro_033639, partial [Colocasia esculenta]|nr:hypothetical protein [Colocasia esculenta]